MPSFRAKFQLSNPDSWNFSQGNQGCNYYKNNNNSFDIKEREEMVIGGEKITIGIKVASMFHQEIKMLIQAI